MSLQLLLIVAAIGVVPVVSKLIQAIVGHAVLEVCGGDEFVKYGREIMQPGQVGRGQLVQNLLTLLGEHDPDQSPIVRVGRPDHQAGVFGAVDKFDGTVRLEQQIAGDVAHRWRRPSSVALDSHKQLVLHVCETGGLRLVFTPVLKAPERDAKRQQLLEIFLAWQGRVTFLALRKPTTSAR